jgi:TolB-like protein/tetratricopeptide (TPR) repeat protein
MNDSTDRESTEDPVAKPATGRLRVLLTKLKRFRGPIVAIAGVGAVLSGLLGYWSAYQTVEKVIAPKQSLEPPAFSLAVLPFTLPDGRPEEQQFADLVVHGIVSALGRTTRYIPVVPPPPTTTSQANHAIDTRAIGRERNVRYVLQGTVRIEGDTAGVAAKLVDAETATQVWAGQFDAARSKWVSESGEAALLVSGQLRDALWSAEEQRVAHRSPKDVSTPSDLVLRAAILERHPDPKRLAEARALVDEALRQDPNYVLALRERIFINGLVWENDPSAHRVQLALETDEFARRALAIDRTDPGVWRARANALGLLWQWDSALDALAEAHRLDPSHLANVVDRVWLLSMMGKADQTVAVVEEALAREPGLDMNPNFRHNQCYAQLLLGRFEEAVASCEKSVAGGDDWWPHFFLTVAYAQTGDMAKAATSKAELLRRRPGFSIAQLNAMGLSDNPVYLKQAETNVISGLLKAGVPEK